MKRDIRYLLSGLLAALALVGCATQQPAGDVGKVVARLPPEQAAKPLPPPLPKLTFDDLARLTKEGVSAEGIIGRLKETRTRIRLLASDVLTLKGRNVPVPVIDYLLDSDRQAVHDEYAEQLNRRDAEAKAALQQAELLCVQRCNLMAPPFGGWPRYPYSPYWRRWP